VAQISHRHGLAAVLENAPELVPTLVRRFDAALAEQCAEYDECAAWGPFVRAGPAAPPGSTRSSSGRPWMPAAGPADRGPVQFPSK
jgi:hypothetical protein